MKIWANKKEDQFDDIFTIELINQIKEPALELPSRFYEIYNHMYPYRLSRGYIQSILYGNQINSCPCTEISYLLHPNANSRIEYQINKLNVIFYLESKFSQKQCFNYTMSRMDFLYQTRGVKEASEFYFKKSINQLSDSEIVNLILMYNNPSYYNPRRTRNLPHTNQRIQEVLNTL